MMLSVETATAVHNFVILSKTAPNLLRLASPDDKEYDDEKFVIVSGAVGLKTLICVKYHVANFGREVIFDVLLKHNTTPCSSRWLLCFFLLVGPNILSASDCGDVCD